MYCEIRAFYNLLFFPCDCRFSSLRTEEAFPVIASLPPKNSVCEPERENDFRVVKPF